MQSSTTFYILWIVAFLGFPLGGSASHLLVGPVADIPRAALAGLVTGAVIGLAQWLILQQVISLNGVWVLATALGMAVGLAAGTAITGTSTEGNTLLIRAAMTGLAIGVAQWLVLRTLIPNSGWWIAIIPIGWTIGWFVTRAVGVDMSQQWSVFGASGAITFQVITLLALWRLLPS
jgi:hypothetical protein